MRFKGILFDKDGTLVDVDGTWVPTYRELLMQELNIDVATAENLMAKAGYIRETGRIAGGSTMAGGTTRQLVDIWFPQLSKLERDTKANYLDQEGAAFSQKNLKPLMPLVPILQELKAEGFKLGIATNDSRPSTERHVAELGIGTFLDCVITADDVPIAKPSGNMIRYFANVVGMEPSEIIMVGDNTHDLEEALHGGAGLGVGVLTGNAVASELEQHADHILASVADLWGLIKTQL